MESPSTYEEVLKYIVYKCRENNHPVADSLVAYLLNILYDENNEDFYFRDNGKIPNVKAAEVINKTIEILNLKCNGILETLKLQLNYELEHIKEEEKVDKIKSFFESEMSKLIKDITLFENISKKDYDSIQMHKKIFSFLLIKTKQNTLNSLNDFNIQNNNLGISSEREIYALLDNVLPKSGLPPFISLSSHDKVSQLNDLSNIIMGIRLLNREVGKGGIGLLTLSDIRKKLGNDLLNKVKNYYNKINQTCENYSLIYENIDFSIIIEKEELEILEKIRKFIIYYRQILTYLSMLMEDLHSSTNTVDNLSIEYDRELKYLIDIVEHSGPISKELVYPHFENTSKLFSKFQEQSFIINIRENVFQSICEFVSSNEIPEHYTEKIFMDKFQYYIENLETYRKRDDPTFTFEAGIYDKGVTVILPNTTYDFLDIKLDYQGFCLVTLLKKQGLLVNGRPNIVTKYKDKYLVFQNNECVQEFIDNPNYIIEEISRYVKKHPYLINLLNMTEEFPLSNLSNIFRDKDMYTYKYKSSSVMVDKQVQTVLHVYENGYHDPNYVWNEWELKKKALQLADIMKKKTVSCQTILSHFRRENETQVWPLKDQSVNTVVSKTTNLSIPKSYVINLRKNENKY